MDLFGALQQRTVIIGNSGSGKSTLAGHLAAWLHVPVVDLDALHWVDAGYGQKRDEEITRGLVVDAAAHPRWIMEGVYGWLAEVAMPRATALIWLDLACCDHCVVARQYGAPHLSPPINPVSLSIATS